MKKIDEGLLGILKGRVTHPESLAFAIQSYLKKEGYRKVETITLLEEKLEKVNRRIRKKKREIAKLYQRLPF